MSKRMPPKVISGGDNPYDIHDAKLSSSATAHESSSVTAHEISNSKMLDMQNEIIETQKQELEVFERFWDKVQKAHEKAGSDRNAADAAESSTT